MRFLKLTHNSNRNLVIVQQLVMVLEKKEKRLAELTQCEELTADDDERGRREDILKKFTEEADQAAADKQSLEKEVKLARMPLKGKAREVDQIKKHYKKGMIRLKKAQQDLQTERNRIMEGAAQSEQAKRLKKIQELEEELASLKPREEQATEERTQQNRLYQESEPLYENVKARCDNLKKQIYAVEKKIEGLDGGNSNKLSVFGRAVPKVCTQIQKYKQNGKFQGQVLGPIGAYIKISAGKERYASIAEMAVGPGTLGSFVVTNAHDRRLMQEIRTNTGCGHRDCVIYQSHPGARYKVPAPPSNDVETVASVLQISEDLVFNCLVDNAKIDQRALAQSKEISERALLQRNDQGGCSIRGNTIKEVFVLPEGDMWSIANGNLQMRSNDKSKMRKTIGVDNEGIKAEFNKELVELKHSLAGEREQEKTTRATMDTHKKAWNKAQKELRALQGRGDSINRSIDDLRAEEETSVNDMVDNSAEYEEDVRNAEQDLEALKEQEENAKKEMKELEPPLLDAQRRLEEKMARNEKILQDMEKAEIDLQQFMQDLSQRQQEVEKRKKKLQKIEETVRMIQERKDVAEEHCETALLTAKKIQFNRNFEVENKAREEGGEDDMLVTQDMTPPEPSEEDLNAIEPVETEKDADYYQGKIKKSEQSLRKQKEKSQIGDKAKETAYEHWIRARNQVKSKQDQIEKIESNTTNLAKDLRKRKKMWRTFRKHLVDRTAVTFDEILQLKGSSGDLDFDHDSGTLNLVVQKENNNEESQTRDVKALSGGERSFTTLALLLALGERLETPFRVMDEFDVFLDPVSRKIAMDTLVEIALTMEHRQFIFITPQDVSSLTPSPKLKIHKMKPPKRGSASVEATQQSTLD